MALQQLVTNGVVSFPDVQRTTMSIDVAGRFVCNLLSEILNPPIPDDTPGPLRSTTVATDVAPPDAIVIGSGMYGSYIASRMYRMGLKVLVLEAGPFLIGEHYQNLSMTGFQAGGEILALEGTPGLNDTQGLVWGQPWRGNELFRRQAFCVGGKSIFWGGWSPRLTDEVLTSRLTNQSVTWPSRTVDFFRDPDLGYERTELEMGVRERIPGQPGSSEIGTDFFNSPQNRLTELLQTKLSSQVKQYDIGHPSTNRNSRAVVDKVLSAPIAVQAQAPASGLFSFKKYSALQTLIANIREDVDRAGSIDARRRLSLVPNTKVLRLETETIDGQEAVTRIKILGANDIVISPQTQVILALSSIESTRLALDSFGSIKPMGDLMGRNAMAHVRNNVTMRIRRSALGLTSHEQLETAAFHLAGRAESGGEFHIQFYAGFSPNSDGDSVLYKMVTDLEVLHQLLLNQDPEWVSLTFRGCGEMVGRVDIATGDDRAGYINLSNEVDAIGNRPRAWVRLVQQPKDLDVFDSIDQVIHQIALDLAGGNASNVQVWTGNGFVDIDASPFRLGGARYSRLAQGEGGIRDGLGTTWHESGTLWMGDTASSSLTNYAGRFHQVANAWCVDQAVFPRVGSANPVPTGITIARLAAETIADNGVEIDRERNPQGRTVKYFHRSSESGFEPLLRFTPGMNLPTGWKHEGNGGFQKFGAILESQGGIGLLYYSLEEFTDLTIRFQWRSPTLRNNSGLYVRIPSKSIGNGMFGLARNVEDSIRTGYEIQIDNSGERSNTEYPNAFFIPHHQTGAIYPVHGFPQNQLPSPNGMASIANIPSKPLGNWNDMEVLVGGNQIRVILNGVRVLDNPGGDYFDSNRRYPKGLIAIQNHFNGHRVQIRHLRINRGMPLW